MERAADVLVVGGGGAGLAAAIEARAAGASVVLFERLPALGGSTARSVGSISVANSRHQRRAGIEDSVEAHYEDLELLAGPYANRDNRALRRLLVERIGETFEWLLGMGLMFVGPMPEPPHRVPRMHNVVPSSRAFPARLGARARALGVEILTGTEVESLTVEAGRVVGLQAGGAAWRVRRGVVLAGGDYSASPAMLAEFASADAARLAPVNPGAVGAGIRLGLSVGGVLLNGDIVRGPVLRFVPPPAGGLADRLPPHPLLAGAMAWGFRSLPPALIRPFLMRFLTTALGLSPNVLRAGAVLVDARGERIEVGEEGPAKAVARQPDGLAWAVLDADGARRLQAWPDYVSTAPGIAYAYLDDYRRTRPDVFHQGSGAVALARTAGLPATAMEQSLAGLGPPPFVALGPVRAYVVFTDGGLQVDLAMRVLREDGSAIPGLFAAGSNGQGGVLLEGHGHHLGWAFVSGRVAGREAAAAVSRG
jgi:succinate dehydrogenase/fumarate reductase flavoprotein subunit